MQASTQIHCKLLYTPRLSKWLPYIFLAIFFALIHLLIRTNYGDDLFFRHALDHKELVPWLADRYRTWSSRLLLETVLVLVLRLPAIFWVIFDIGFALLLYSGLRQMLSHDKTLKDNILLALLLCTYPFFHMGSAGWVTTTVNYFWPLSLAAFASGGIAQWLRGEHIPWYRWPAYTAAVVFGCNNELIAIMILAAGIAVLFYAAWTKMALYVPLSGIALSMGSLAFALTAPGNGMRMAAETLNWMPDFPTFSLMDKLRIGIVSTVEHYLSIPNVVLLLFLLLIAIQVFRESSSLKKRLVGVLPIIIQVACGTYFSVEKLFITRAFKYSAPDIKNFSGTLFQGMMIASFLILILCIAASLFWILRDNKKVFFYLLALGTGLSTRLSLSFSPTVLASGTRTYMLVYFVLLGMIFLLWKRGLSKKTEYILLCIAFLGMIFNVLTVN